MPYSSMRRLRSLAGSAALCGLLSLTPSAQADIHTLEKASACAAPSTRVSTSAVPMTFLDATSEHAAYQGVTASGAGLVVGDDLTFDIALEPADGLPPAQLKLELRSPHAAHLGARPAIDAWASVLDRRSVTYRPLYESLSVDFGSGLDLSVTGTGQFLDFHFEGTRPELPSWKLSGVEDVRQINGQVHARFGDGGSRVAVWREPLAWQGAGDEKTTVAAAWELSDDGLLAIRLGAAEPGVPVQVKASLVYSIYQETELATDLAHGRQVVVGTSPVTRKDGTVDTELVALLVDTSGRIQRLDVLGTRGADLPTALARDGDLVVVGATDGAGRLRLWKLDASGDLLGSSLLSDSGLGAIDGLAFVGRELHATGPVAGPEVRPATAGVAFTAFTTDSAEKAPYRVVRLDEEGRTVAATSFEAPHGRQMKAWTSCAGGELFIGLPVAPRAESELVSAKAAPCYELKSSLGQVDKAEPCLGGSSRVTDIYQIDQITGYTTPGFLVDNGWGYHALRWKNLQSGVSYSPFNALGVPTGSFVSQFDDTALNNIEADTSVFPTNPSGTWSGGSVTDAIEMTLVAAMFMDRFNSPLYLSMAPPSSYPFGDVPYALKRVVFEVDNPPGSMRLLCTGWPRDSGHSIEDVASDCSFFESSRFSLSSLRTDHWEGFTFVADRTLTATTFISRFGFGFRDWVADPPASEAHALPELLDSVRQLRSRMDVELPAGSVKVRTFGLGHKSSSTDLPSVSVRAIDLGR